MGADRSSSRRSDTGSGAGRRGRTVSPSSAARKTKDARAAGSGTKDLTPPTLAVAAGSNRRDEVIGLGLVAIGTLLGLALYFGLAGPVGRGLNTGLGWVMGLGRYLVPVTLIAVGIAFVRAGRSSSPIRLVIGWSMVFAALLGMIHLARGPDGFSGPASDFGSAGGYLGAVFSEPLRLLVASIGAAVVLIAIGAGGALLITKTSVRTMAERTSRSVAQVAKPIGRATRKALSDLSTLSSDRAVDTAGTAGPGAENAGFDHRGGGLYDFAADGDDFGSPEEPISPSPERPKRAPRKKAPASSPAIATSGAEAVVWDLPDNSLLIRSGKHSIDRATIDQRGLTLQESLAQHGVETTLVGTTVGPTVTRYELELGPGIKVARVTSLQRDIAYAMAATDVRILAPIPGRSAIGVEVPNEQRQLVALGDLLTSREAAQADHPLDVAIGKDIAGRAVFLNLATTPHLLIAGATGAGKSSGLNCIITSLLMRSTPDQVRLILVDPKQVEMGQYQRLPHLLTQPVTDPKKAANALGWAVKEMERRYDLLSTAGVRDITSYNEAIEAGVLQPVPTTRTAEGEEEPPPPTTMPYIVVVVDELNDLMMVAARDVEDSITRIAQKARAVGIHLIVATQRPSVNVITGVIKANIPARMAFAVSSLTDSRVILDQPGAEKLVGQGDMLLLPGNSSVAQRIQGSFVSEREVRSVVEHWREQAPDPITSELGGPATEDVVTSSANSFSGGDDDGDEDAVMMRQAMELVVRSQLGSTSMLQRKLKVGFARAGRIMDLLEQRGVVGPSEGSKAREVLMTVEEFELLQRNDTI
jgi:S-DNA-T family DNA segregation ATPase FtsK/SpoIIIE